MKRIVVFLFLSVCISTLQAQSLRFGYFSYEKVLTSMPSYVQVQQDLAGLKAQYEQELQLSQQEFSSKYEDYLEGLDKFAVSIRKKRQQDLEQLASRNEAFRSEAKRLLKQAEEDALEPLHARIRTAVQYLGEEQHFAFILNTDDNSAPFVSSEMGTDVTPILIERLK